MEALAVEAHVKQDGEVAGAEPATLARANVAARPGPIAFWEQRVPSGVSAVAGEAFMKHVD